MCSRGSEDEFDNEGCATIKKTIISNDIKTENVCKKCGKPAAIFIRRSGTYCSDCMLALVNHKFRACLGKSKIVRKNEKVLIAFSGGKASSLMLYFVKKMLDEATLKRIDIRPVVIYIDESALFNEELNSCENNLKDIISVLNYFGFPATYLTSLESIMIEKDEDISKLLVAVGDLTGKKELSNETLRNRLKVLFQSISESTLKEDLLLKLRNELLARIAVNLSCTKVFVGDSQDGLAVRLLSDIALGKGQSLPKAVGLSDDRFEGVLLVRPMREVLNEEISYCVNWLKLKILHQPSFYTKGDSIQSTTETFVMGLQNDFPATVSTIFRTGDKLGSNLNKNSIKEVDKNNCVICSADLKVNDMEDNFSLLAVSCQNKASSCSCLCENSTKDQSNNCSQVNEVIKFCCYSCRQIVNEMSISSIPAQVLDKVNKRSRRLWMRNEISEFLLDASS